MGQVQIFDELVAEYGLTLKFYTPLGAKVQVTWKVRRRRKR